MSDIAFAGVGTRRIAPAASRSAAPRRAFSAEVLVGSEAYDTLQSDWDALLSAQTGAVLFQAPAMLAAWARHFKSERATPVTIALRNEGRIALIWPLLVERRTAVTVALGAGNPIGQYDDFLIAEGVDARSALTEALDLLRDTHKPDLVILERVRNDSALRTALNETSPLCTAEAAPYVDLSRGLEQMHSGRKSSTARQQRKRVRRFEESGNASFTVARDAVEAEAWMLEALALKNEWLRETGRVSRAFMRPATGNCLTEMARTLSDEGNSPRAILSRLTLDQRTAAIEAGFLHRGTYHLYLRAFASRFSKLGPGNILTQRILEWCAAEGVQRYDMLAPRARNKAEWQSGEVGVSDFALPLTSRGRFYSETVLRRLQPRLRDAFYCLPEKLRSAIAGAALRM